MQGLETRLLLKEYLYLHGDAKLTPQDKDVLCNWVKAELKKIEDDVEMDDKEKKEDKGKK